MGVAYLDAYGYEYEMIWEDKISFAVVWASW